MKITKDHINGLVRHSQFHRFTGTTTTVCCLTLANGHTAVGKSACADPEEFDEAVGAKLAYEDAIKQIWPLEGYLLSEALYQEGRERNGKTKSEGWGENHIPADALDFTDKCCNQDCGQCDEQSNERSTDAEESVNDIFNEVLKDLFAYGHGKYSVDFPEIDPDLADIPCNIEVDENLPENTIEIHVHHHGINS